MVVGRSTNKIFRAGRPPGGPRCRSGSAPRPAAPRPRAGRPPPMSAGTGRRSAVGQRLQPVRSGQALHRHRVTPRYSLAWLRICSAERNGPTCRPAIVPSARTKKVCGGPVICSGPDSSLVLVHQLGEPPGQHPGELDGPVRPRVLVVDSQDHQVGVVGIGDLGDEGSLVLARLAPLRPDVDHHRSARVARPAERRVHRPGRTGRRPAARRRPRARRGRTSGSPRCPPPAWPAPARRARSPARSVPAASVPAGRAAARGQDQGGDENRDDQQGERPP